MIQQVATPISADPWATTAFFGYLGLVVLIGFLASRFSSKGITEFFLAGRKLNRFVVALSAVVSGRSAWLILGVSGMAYSRGLSALWAVVGYTTVELFLFLYYAPRIRRFSEAYDCVTITDFFADRFEDRDNTLRLLLTVVIALFMVGYVAAQFVAGGKAFATSFAVDERTGIVVTAAIVLVYTVLGGFLAVSLTDMLQAIFMILALLVLPVVALVDAGGLSSIVARLAPTEGFLDPLALGVGVLLGFIGIGLGSPGNPHILVRYMSVADPAQLRTSAWVATVWNVVMGAGAIAAGVIGRFYFPTQDALLNSDPENLYPLLAGQHLHPALFGMVIAAIFAAIMSTADSQLLVAASALVRDLYQKTIKKGADIPQKTLVILSRSAVILLVATALGVGFAAQKLVFWLVLFAWAGLGAALGPTSILALFWKRTTRAGVIAGLATGAITTIVWYYIPALKDSLYELIPGFAAGLTATVAVSHLTRPPRDAEAMMERMKGITKGRRAPH